MASRAHRPVSVVAVERARSRIPGFSPDSVQVVELARGNAFVVVRMLPSGVVVLDRAGRLVRGRDRLATIGRHLRAVEQVGQALAEARLEQRGEHAALSGVLLERLEGGFRGIGRAHV